MRFILLFVAFISLPFAVFANTSKLVVTSIKPIYSLVTSVTEGTGVEVVLLVDGNQSPHHFSLKPSDMRALQSSAIVFYIHEGFEPYLTKPLAVLAEDSNVVALADDKNIVLYDKEAEHVGHSAFGGHDAAKDYHTWLDPINAKHMVYTIKTELSKVFPDYIEKFDTNTSLLLAELDHLHLTNISKLTGIDGNSYILFHDAYQYFEHRYGLSSAGVMLLGERMPTIRHVRYMREILDDEDVKCVFSEPQINPDLIDVVTEGRVVRRVELDPLGFRLTKGPEMYVALIENLVDGFVACLR